MYEVELKVRADHGAVRERLGEADAERERAVRQVDTYYDAPHRDFAETDEALRVRREHTGDGETTKLTYKGPLIEAESKSREEHETVVADAGAAEEILTGLGFSPAAEVHKQRERYQFGEYTVALDRVDGLGDFVEVETETDDEDIEEARDGARNRLETLGLDPTEQIRTSYLGLLLGDD